MSEEQENTAEAAETAGVEGELPPSAAEMADPAGNVSELDAVTAERNKFKEQLYRTAADLENFRKRSRRDVEDALKRGREDTVREFLPIIDNLERAVAAADGATDVAAVVQGVQMVLRGFEEVASRVGVARVQALGLKFDPTVHDAVQQLPTSDHEPGTVMAEIMPGYVMGEKLIRAAMVVVARPAPEAAAPAESPEASADDLEAKSGQTAETVDLRAVLKDKGEDDDVHFIDEADDSGQDSGH